MELRICLGGPPTECCLTVRHPCTAAAASSCRHMWGDALGEFRRSTLGAFFEGDALLIASDGAMLGCLRSRLVLARRYWSRFLPSLHPPFEQTGTLSSATTRMRVNATQGAVAWAAVLRVHHVSGHHAVLAHVARGRVRARPHVRRRRCVDPLLSQLSRLPICLRCRISELPSSRSNRVADGWVSQDSRISWDESSARHTRYDGPRQTWNTRAFFEST